MRGAPKTKLSSGRCAHCRVLLNSSVSAYQLVVLWEATFSFIKFFWTLFQCICPFHDGWFMNTPAHTVPSVQQFLAQNGKTPVPHIFYLPDLPLSNFSFVSPIEKTPQRKTLLMWKRWIKSSRSTKKHQNWWVQKLFWAVEKRLHYLRVYYTEWRVLWIWRWLKSKHVTINTQFFISKFFFYPPLLFFSLYWIRI